MRHRNFGKKLGRNHNQRKALLKNLALAVFTYGSIETTMAKATAVSPLLEKMCRLSLKADLVSRRSLFAYFQSQTTINLICTRMKENFADHKGSFLTIDKIKRRQGDDALVVKLALSKPFNLKVEEVKVEKKAVKPVKAIKPVKVVKAVKAKS